MTTRFLTAVAATAALVASGSPFAQSAPGLTREQVRQDMQRYEAAGFNPARMNPRSWVDDAQPPRPGYRPVTPTTRARSSPGTAPRRAATERATHFFLRSGSRHAIRLHPDRGTAPDGAAAWGAVLAMSLGAFALVASEFMPVSLLTPIAGDLHVSEGQAGWPSPYRARSRWSRACSSPRSPAGAIASRCCWC